VTARRRTLLLLLINSALLVAIAHRWRALSEEWRGYEARLVARELLEARANRLTHQGEID